MNERTPKAGVRFFCEQWKTARTGGLFCWKRGRRNGRLAAALLCCALLCGCGTAPTPPLEEEPEAGTERPSIAYVPLDDRPDNVERVVYLAESLNYRVLLPETDDYRTRLNGQPRNDNGTQFGDRAALYEWVLAQEAAGCDRYILSMDQLLSGGLVNSRAMAEREAVTLSDGMVLTEEELQKRLLAALSEDADNRVWLLESVMRLAPTVGYQHWTLEEYNALRAYGMAPRPALEGPTLTVENIQSNYPLDSGGAAMALAAFGLTEDEAAEYLSARARKLELSKELLGMLQGNDYEHFRILIGIDDSSQEDSIQKNEIAFLRKQLGNRGALLSGVDDLAFKAVAKLYLEETDWSGTAVSVRYFGGMEDQPACAYDYQPLNAIIQEHADFFGLSLDGDAPQPLELLVLTQPADESKKASYYEALIDALRLCQKERRPTILIDAGNGTYGTAFHDALTEQVELGQLLSYAGFLDMAIVTGTALSHGVARYAYLREGYVTDSANRAFARTLADSVIKDFCYKNVVREDLLSYIRNDLGGNPDNFWQPDIDREAVLTRLESGMTEQTKKTIQNLEQSNLLVSLDESAGALAGWGGVELANYRFPWDRAFEIGMDIRLGTFTAPHKNLTNHIFACLMNDRK